MNFRRLLKKNISKKGTMIYELKRILNKIDNNVEMLVLFEKLNIGEYSLSIQGGEFFYSKPMKTVDIDKYEGMELIISRNDIWTCPSNDSNLKNFHRLYELMIFYETITEIPIGKYVPIDLIQDVVNYLFVLEKVCIQDLKLAI